MNISKRNGKIVNFNPEKIIIAIEKAMAETKQGIDNELSSNIAYNIENDLQNLEEISTVESIQDLVEDYLMDSNRKDVAKRYILYRAERTLLRDQGWEMSDLQRDIYEQKYRYKNESFDEFLNRVSGGNQDIKKGILNKQILPAGRVLAGRGLNNDGRKVTLSNCFPAGTQVMTENGYKSIEDIKIGDKVVTHTNNVHNIDNTLERQYSGRMYEIKTTTSKVTTTEEHPFYTQRGWVKAKDLQKSDYIKVGKKSKKTEQITFDLLDYIDLNDQQTIVEKDNQIAVSTSFIGGNGAKGSKIGNYINRYVEVDNELLYAFGVWLGNGRITKREGKNNHSIFQIVGNKKEEEQIMLVKKILDEKFGIDLLVSENEEQNTIILRIDNEILSEFFFKMFGKYFNEKQIPEIFSSNFHIALGVIDSDGMILSDGSIRFSLSNKKLISQIQSILELHGYPSNPIRSTGRNGYNLWTFGINKCILNNLLKLMSRYYDDNRQIPVDDDKVNKNTIKIKDNEIYSKINSIISYDLSEIGAEIPVYNISVNTDNSYVVNGLVCHNCYVLPKPSDSIESIFDTAKDLARTFSYGGGVGFNISNLRPKNARVNNAAVTTTGAVSFMDLYSLVTGLIGQNSRRGKFVASIV